MTPQFEEAQRLLRLAKRDQEAFEILAAAGDQAHAAAGFQAQQSVEKALKAVLCMQDIDFPRTHDLENLFNRISGSGLLPDFPSSRLRPLTPYAVDFRYDDEVVSLLSLNEMKSIVEDMLCFATAELERSIQYK
jgi:HEPN domain-containing protein